MDFEIESVFDLELPFVHDARLIELVEESPVSPERTGNDSVAFAELKLVAESEPAIRRGT